MNAGHVGAAGTRVGQRVVVGVIGRNRVAHVSVSPATAEFSSTSLIIEALSNMAGCSRRDFTHRVLRRFHHGEFTNCRLPTMGVDLVVCFTREGIVDAATAFLVVVVVSTSGSDWASL